MKKTVLITGTSSGIGKASVFEFAQMGWNVIATQRNPEKEHDFDALPQVKLVQLDCQQRRIWSRWHFRGYVGRNHREAI